MNFANLSNSSSNNVILCSYKNQTSQLQVLRISHSKTGCFECVAFPFQHLLFEAEDQANLEVYYTACCDSIEMKEIPCISLKVNEIP
ncbi:hypothetical protein M595_4235 [Lyngbya aestuarii BL J]|uniref:Uncharacterized protein n=1 Tax=Lyngbya aestuarii BL J TaxID=1348334 RepID=U7QDB0_9CYAN|nr:DUF1830 domain-containing protein [Lyngbya aestuarii]ERT05828.1 hypothetical protein M595_4235 [Lyngbya aestuarii BL J]